MKMKLTITISSENQAVNDDPQGTVKESLQVIISRIVNDGEHVGLIRDINGNTIGKWEYKTTN